MSSTPPVTPPSPGPPTPPGSPDELKLYKLEYERAAIRYNDIYNAIWQIFSYMSVVSGGILAFGAEHFHYTLLFFLALFPLVFWFWAVFRPHDEYGESCLHRLKVIEKDLNLRHYRAFQELKNSEEHTRQFKNVKTWVRWVFVTATVIWLGFAVAAGYQRWKGGTKLILEKPAEVKIVTLSPEELKKLLGKANVPGPGAQPAAVPGEKTKTK